MLDPLLLHTLNDLAPLRVRLAMPQVVPSEWARLLAESDVHQADRELRKLGEPCADAEYALQGGLLIQRHLQQVLPLTPQAQRALIGMEVFFAVGLLRAPEATLATDSPLLQTLQAALRHVARVEPEPSPAVQAMLSSLQQRLLAGARDLLMGAPMEKGLARFRDALGVLVARDALAVEESGLALVQQTALREIRQRLLQRVWGQPVPALLIDFLDQRASAALARLSETERNAAWTHVEMAVNLAVDASPDLLAARGEIARQTCADGLRDLGADGPFIDAFEDLLAARARRAPDAGLPLGEWPEDPVTDEGHVDHAGLARVLSADAWLWPGANGLRRVGVQAVGDHVVALDALCDVVGKPVSVPRFLDAVQAGRVMPQSLAPSLGLLSATLQPWAEAWRNDLQHQLERQHALEARQKALEEEFRQAAERAAAAEHRAERIRQYKADARHRTLVAHWQRELTHVMPGAVLQWAVGDDLRSGWLQKREQDQWSFVDRQGRLLRQQDTHTLISELIAGDCTWLDSGSSLDDTLADLIKERRRTLQDEG